MDKPKGPPDPNLLGKSIVDIATGDISDQDPGAGKDLDSVQRTGDLKGGKGRATKLPAKQRKKIVKKSAKARVQATRNVR